MPNVDFLSNKGVNLPGRSADYSQYIEQRRIAATVKQQKTKSSPDNQSVKPWIREGLLTKGTENGSLDYYVKGKYMPRVFLSRYGSAK
jgi:hypothetical protein